MGCSVKCSAPLATAELTDTEPMLVFASASTVAWNPKVYDPFIARPPPPIPIV